MQIRSLEGVGVKSESFDNLLVPLLLSKVPEVLRLKLANAAQDEQWSLNKFLELLLREIKSREKIMSVSSPHTHRTGSSNSHYTHKQNIRAFNAPRVSETLPQFHSYNHNKALTSFERPNSKCLFCGGSRTSKVCEKYGTLDEGKKINLRAKIMLPMFTF